jgi:ABC-type bacteriocin/lantibiotic exporter with double-glycine peptidase domain
MSKRITHIFVYFRDLVRMHAGAVTLVILLQIAIDCLYNALPLYTRHFIDFIVPGRSLAALVRFTGLLFVNMAAIISLQYVINRYQEKVKLALTFALDNQVLGKILNAPIRLLGQKPGSFHANRIKQDTDGVIGFYQYFTCQFISNLATAVWVMVYALSISVWIAVAMAGVFFPLYLFVKRYYDTLRHKMYAVRDQHSDIETFRYETLAGLRSIKLWLAQRYRMAVYRDRYDEYQRNSVSLSVAEFYPSLIQEAFVEYLPTLGVFLLGGYMVLHGRITLGQWTALSLYATSFVGPLSRVANIGGKLSVVAGTIDRLKEYTSLPDESEEPGPFPGLPSQVEHLRVDRVTFSYPDQTKALDNVSFKCSRGEVCAIVGGSGAGKSTLAYIIAALYSPQLGGCSINGIPYGKLPVSYVRSKVTVASISDFLFSETIADNIRIGKPLAEEAEVKIASQRASARDFIDTAEKGFETRLGEGGLGLSDGQIQRIVLSRLFLKGGDVLILDEATASLDPETERQVLSNLLALYKERIIILITHHPSVARCANSVFVMENGAVADSGTHDELMNTNAYYRDLMRRGSAEHC